MTLDKLIKELLVVKEKFGGNIPVGQMQEYSHRDSDLMFVPLKTTIARKNNAKTAVDYVELRFA